jgi:hypothetical protein
MVEKSRSQDPAFWSCRSLNRSPSRYGSSFLPIRFPPAAPLTSISSVDRRRSGSGVAAVANKEGEQESAPVEITENFQGFLQETRAAAGGYFVDAKHFGI